MEYRLSSIAINAQKESLGIPTQSSFHVCWRDGSLFLKLIAEALEETKPDVLCYQVEEGRRG